MTTRLVILLALLACAAAVLISGVFEVTPGEIPPTRRHVLLLTVDTLRADHVDGDQYPVPTAPVLTRLVSEGHRFLRAVTPVPRTTQAVASLLTGVYPHTTEVRTLADTMAPQIVSVAELFRAAGYRTRAVVSNHVLLPRRGLHRGFEVYDHSGDGRGAAATTAAMLRYAEKLDPAEPAFLWIHYIDPHVPYAPGPELAAKFDPGYRGRYRDHFGGEVGATGPAAFPPDLPKIEAIYRNNLPDDVNRHIRTLYAADVRATDMAVETLLEGLKKRLGDDWTVIFTADHGESLGEHDYYYEHGDYVWNETVLVPLAFSFPPGDPLRRSQRVDAWVSLVDVAPTLIELFALPVPVDLPYPIEGRSLVPYFEGKQLPPAPVFAECDRSHFPGEIKRRVRFDVAGRFRAVFLDRFKLIWTPGQTEDLEYQLYDLELDPSESSDLSQVEPEVVRDLRDRLREWLRDDSTVVPAEPDEEDLKALRALGYVD